MTTMNQLRLSIVSYNILVLLLTPVKQITARPNNRAMSTISRTAFISAGGVDGQTQRYQIPPLRHRSHLYHSNVPNQTPPPSDPTNINYTLKKRNPYDVHVYYADQPQREEATALRDTMTRTFPWMNFYRPKNGPIGPHPIPMWEADFGGYENRDRLGEVCDFLERERGSLSVLVHPHSADEDYTDHTRHALWFGAVLELRIGGWRSD